MCYNRCKQSVEAVRYAPIVLLAFVTTFKHISKIIYAQIYLNMHTRSQPIAYICIHIYNIFTHTNASFLSFCHLYTHYDSNIVSYLFSIG
jgi:hypothetical protein